LMWLRTAVFCCRRKVHASAGAGFRPHTNRAGWVGARFNPHTNRQESNGL
jgi:hypothetical protein